LDSSFLEDREDSGGSKSDPPKVEIFVFIIFFLFVGGLDKER